jgi:lipoyl(octanoyl) transferase
MQLEHFDEGRFSAVENMARDLLLLEAYPHRDALRLRHYKWEPDCFSFGYSQIYDWIAGQAVRGAQLARRPTGGGLVDHRSDWTYAIAIPPEHPFYRAPAIDVYRYVHEAIAQALEAVGRPATLQPEEDDHAPLIPGLPHRVRGLCFAGAEPCDVIDPVSRKKIAGAAMKRNHTGLLMQGSIDRLVAGEVDWTAFREHFVRNLAVRFGATNVDAVEPPTYPKEILAEAIAKLGSDHWNRRR